MHTAFQPRLAFAEQVVRRSRCVIVKVMGKVERFLLEPVLRHEGSRIEDDFVVFVEIYHAQAQPLVEHGARTDVLAHTGNQAFERKVSA